MDAETPTAAKQSSIRVLVAVIVLASLIALVLLHQGSQWWNKGVSFGGEVGRYRVDGVGAGSIGSAGGLEAEPTPPYMGERTQLFVKVGDTVDIHLDGSWGRIVSSNPNVVGEINGFWSFLSGSVRFEALAAGTADLATVVNAPDCSGNSSPGVRSRTRCRVLTITVLSS